MTRKVKVLIDHLHHDGIARRMGDLIEMNGSQIEPLVRIGAVQVVADDPPPPDPEDKDPVQGDATDDNPEQPQPNPAPTDNADANQTDVQQQPDVSASTNNDAGSGAPKTGNKASKSKAK